MATLVEPGRRSATLEAQTVKRAIALYLAQTHGVVVHFVDGKAVDGKPQFTGIELHADGSAHVTLHEQSKPFQREPVVQKGDMH